MTTKDSGTIELKTIPGTGIPDIKEVNLYCSSARRIREIQTLYKFVHGYDSPPLAVGDYVSVPAELCFRFYGTKGDVTYMSVP